MSSPALQITFITHDAHRAETVEGVIAGQNWRLLPILAHEQPLARLDQQQSDAVLLDLGAPDALALVEAIAREHMHTPLIVLAGPTHLTDLQKALHSGAKTFITYPIEPQQIVAAIQQARQNDSPAESAPAARRRGRILTVTGLKGGIGRSTIAANLAVTLQQRKQGDVILVEAHGGLSDLSLLLNLHPPRTSANLATVGDAIDQDVIQGHLHEHSSGLRVLAAPSSLSALAEIPAICWGDIFHILKEIAAYIIVDTAPAIDECLSQVLNHTDDILIVVNPDLPSLRAATALLEALAEETAILAHTHLVLNREGVRGGVDRKTMVEQLRQDFVAALPDDAPLATFSYNRGIPFCTSRPRALLSRRLESLAHNLCADPASAQPAPSSKRILIPFLQPRPA